MPPETKRYADGADHADATGPNAGPGHGGTVEDARETAGQQGDDERRRRPLLIEAAWC